MLTTKDLLHIEGRNLYCPGGDFYLDPMRKVKRAVITHGHADHARAGHDTVIATAETLAAMRLRYGAKFCRQAKALPYGETVDMGEVRLTLQPAGHILGSAQAVIERGGRRAIFTGDYKRRPDPTCPPFIALEADLLVSEATFGLPLYQHPPAAEEIAKLLTALELFSDRSHLLSAYSLGKAQRMIALLRQAGYDAPIYADKTVSAMCALYERFGVALGRLQALESAKDLTGALVVHAGRRDLQAHPALVAPMTISASGWHGVRGNSQGRRPANLKLVISDHADWSELTATIDASQAPEVWCVYGFAGSLRDYALRQGRHARLIGKG